MTTFKINFTKDYRDTDFPDQPNTVHFDLTVKDMLKKAEDCFNEQIPFTVELEISGGDGYSEFLGFFKR